MAATPQIDLVCPQGATWNDGLIWEVSEKVPQDLTDYTAAMQVRPTAESTEVIISATTANGKLVISAAEGLVTFNIDATETAALSPAQFPAVYDLELTSPTGTVTRLARGAVTLELEVTR